MFIFRQLPAMFYETPGGAAAGAAPLAQGQPPAAAPQAQPQPGAPGQGPAQGSGFRQTFFPNVDDQAWATIEPHMQNINRHVDQLQQTYAPLKGFTPQAIQGLAQFSQRFEQDPVGQWIQLAQALQGRGIVDPDLDLEYLAAIAQGQAPPDEGDNIPDGMDPNNPLTQTVLALQKQVEELSGSYQKDQQTTRERTEDIALQRQLATLKSKLTEGGFPEEALTPQYLLSSYIANRGNLQAAIEQATGMRNTLLTGFVQDPTPQPQNGQPKPPATRQDLDLPNGSPQARGRKPAASGRRGMFRDVEAAAEQALRSADNG